MRIVAVYAIKGGVGKTAAAVNIAAEAAIRGLRVLLWDLDPQGAASFYLRVEPKIRGGGKKLMLGGTSLDDHLRATDIETLDVMPADFSYRNLDLLFGDSTRPTRQLSKVLNGLEAEYDLVILDCPPGITLLSENILHAVDGLLVPVIPTTLSLRTLEQLRDFIAGKKGLDELLVMPFLSMVDRRRALHREVAGSFYRQEAGALRTVIPYSSAIERMGVEEAPLQLFAANTPAAKAVTALWRNVRRRVF